MNLKLIMAGVFTLVLAASHVFVWRQGGLEARKDAAEYQAKEMRAVQALSNEFARRAIVAETTLSELLNAPKAEPQVRTIVRENPSSCTVPKPVDDQLRKSRSEANARIRGTLSPR